MKITIASMAPVAAQKEEKKNAKIKLFPKSSEECISLFLESCFYNIYSSHQDLKCEFEYK